MSRTGINYDSVKQAAIKLLSQGSAPSVQKVRELLGTGSNTTIAEHLKSWREEHAKKVIHHLPATLPKELIATFEVLWQTAMEHAQNQLAAQKQELDQERTALEQQQRETEKEINQLKQQVQAHVAQLAQATADTQQCHIELAVMNERLEKQTQASGGLTEQYEARLKHAYAQKDGLALQHQQLQNALKALQEQLNAQVQQSQHLQTQQATLHEQSEARWLQIIDKTRQEAKDNQKKLEKLCDAKEAHIQSLMLDLSKLQNEAHGNRAQLIEAATFAEIVISQFNLNREVSKSSLNKIQQELIEKYEKHHCNLDSKFLAEIKSYDYKKAISCLWELIILDNLSQMQGIQISHDNSGPDWGVTLKNGKKCFIEATCAQLPTGQSPEINRVISQFQCNGSSISGEPLIREVKLRISNAIDAKIKKHGKFMAQQNCGYILFVSYGGIATSCDLYHAVSTVLPIGDLSIGLSIDKKSGKIKDVEGHVQRQDFFIKQKCDKSSTINANIFLNNEYNWISAVLFSKVSPVLLLEQVVANSSYLDWKDGVHNDFVLIHNPLAKYPLDEELLEVASTLVFKDGKLLTTGPRIFPQI